MTTPTIHALDQEMIDRAVAFHGSLCPGLAMGIQAARLALREVGEHGADNPLVAVAETEICALDAVQALVGVTAGNRNLIIKDYGKLVFTFYRTTDGRAVRLAGKPTWDPEYQALRKRVHRGQATAEELATFDDKNEAEAGRVLNADPDSLYTITEVRTPAPATHKSDPWLECATCKEPVMETRTRHLDGNVVCIPCFEAATANGRSKQH